MHSKSNYPKHGTFECHVNDLNSKLVDCVSEKSSSTLHLITFPDLQIPL